MAKRERKAGPRSAALSFVRGLLLRAPLPRPRVTSPPFVAVLSYGMFAVIGTILLSLPFATEGPRLSVMDALFLSTSAICVTGLSPIASLSDQLSSAGWWILLVMIQLGGVGLVLLGVALVRWVGQDLSLRHLVALKESYAETSGVWTILRRVLLITFVIEALGAGFLFWRWQDHDGAGFLAVFHSISAFCNAGFSTAPNGLMDLSGDAFAVVGIMLLIVTGGLGFRVITELLMWCFPRNGKRERLSLFARLVLKSTGVLIVLGTVLFCVLESGSGVLGGMPAFDRVMTCVFQSVTTRTAGFNTVDFGELRAATLLVLIVFMMIGGSPGSTAGGMKTVASLVVLRFVWQTLRGRAQVVFSHRAIPLVQVRKAVFIVAIYVTTMMLSLFALTLLVDLDTDGAPTFLALLFEAGSALGTVGLSTGITADLGAGPKLVLIVTMLLGRVGPLTIALMVPPDADSAKLKYPEESVTLG